MTTGLDAKVIQRRFHDAVSTEDVLFNALDVPPLENEALDTHNDTYALISDKSNGQHLKDLRELEKSELLSQQEYHEEVESIEQSELVSRIFAVSCDSSARESHRYECCSKEDDAMLEKYFTKLYKNEGKIKEFSKLIHSVIILSICCSVLTKANSFFSYSKFAN